MNSFLWFFSELYSLFLTKQLRRAVTKETTEKKSDPKGEQEEEEEEVERGIYGKWQKTTNIRGGGGGWGKEIACGARELLGQLFSEPVAVVYATIWH